MCGTRRSCSRGDRAVVCLSARRRGGLLWCFERALAAAAACFGAAVSLGARTRQHAERVVSAVDSDDRRSADFVHGHPWFERSRLRPLPSVLPNARVPLDEAQGTGGVSRRLRRERFRRLKPAGTPDVRVRRSEPSDSQGLGARMRQHAERVTPAVDSDANGSADSRLRALMV
jgi:hypothetical protein